MRGSFDALVEPQALIWARKRLGFERLAAALALDVSAATLAAWESGISRPTIAQASRLAACFRVPLSTLYLEHPPWEFKTAPVDFRRAANGERLPGSPVLIAEWLRAYARSQLAANLTSEPNAPLFAGGQRETMATDAEASALTWRERFAIDLAQQRRLGQSDHAGIDTWSDAVESQGVCVSFTDDAGGSIDPGLFRALTFYDKSYSVITLNAGLASPVQVFTLLHEFGRLLLGGRGISNGWLPATAGDPPGDTEQWCNRFAAAFLMPEAAFRAHPITVRCAASNDWSADAIPALAADFGMGEEAIVRRLLTLGLISHTLYVEMCMAQAATNPATSQPLRKGQSAAGFPSHQNVLRREGRRFARTMLRAHHDGRIGLRELAGCLQSDVACIQGMEKELFC